MISRCGLRTAGIFISITSFTIPASGQVPVGQRFANEGYVVTLVEAHQAAHSFDFVVQKGGATDIIASFTVSGGSVEIVSVDVFSNQTAAIVTKTTGGLQFLEVVDLLTGGAIVRQSCSDIRVTADKARLVCQLPASTDRLGYDVSRKRLVPLLNPVDGFLRALQNGTYPAKRRMLGLYLRSEDVRRSPEVRRALLESLGKEIETDKQAAVLHPSTVRMGSDARDYLASLVPVAAGLHEDVALKLIAQADVRSAVGALVSFGVPAIPIICDALQPHAPFGYSRYYRAGLLEALTSILHNPGVTDVARQRVVAAGRRSVAGPGSALELLEGLRVLEVADPDAAEEVARPLSKDEETIRELGIRDPFDIASVRRAATTILASHVVIK